MKKKQFGVNLFTYLIMNQPAKEIFTTQQIKITYNSINEQFIDIYIDVYEHSATA